MEIKSLVLNSDSFRKLVEIAREDIMIGHVAQCIKNGRCVGLFNKSNIIGVVTFCMNPKTIVLGELFIEKNWRKRGLAYALMHTCVEIVREYYANDFDVYVEWNAWDNELDVVFNKIGIKTADGQFKIDVKKLNIKAKKALKRYHIKRA